jgi:hypothetical protein
MVIKVGVLEKIKQWYKGAPLPVKEVNSLTSTTHRLPNTYEPSALALLAQWLVKNMLIIIGLIVTTGTAFFIHYDGKPIEETEHEKSE